MQTSNCILVTEVLKYIIELLNFEENGGQT